MNTKYYKQQEINDYATEQLNERIEYDKDYLNKDLSDIHHDLFNTDYYIIGRYAAIQWLEDETFNVIETIREYEENNFGSVVTDFSCPEKVVNMYVYIVGEHILDDCILAIKNK